MSQPTFPAGRSTATPPSIEAIIAAIADRQHSLITFWQLLAAGLSDSAIAKRVARGLLRRVHRGVYPVGHGLLSRHARWHAATLAAGDGSASASSPRARSMRSRASARPSLLCFPRDDAASQASKSNAYNGSYVKAATRGLDGPHHGRKADARQDKALAAAGYETLRFTDEDVYRRPDWVLARLKF